MKAHQTRSMEDVTMMSEIVALPRKLLKDLEVNDKWPHRITLIAQRCGLVLDHAIEDVSVRPARQQAATDLNIPEGEGTLYVDRVVFSNGIPVEWRRAFCKISDSFRYRVMMR